MRSEFSSMVFAVVKVVDVDADESVKDHRAAFLAANELASFLRRRGKADVLAGAVARTCYKERRSGGGDESERTLSM